MSGVLQITWLGTILSRISKLNMDLFYDYGYICKSLHRKRLVDWRWQYFCGEGTVAKFLILGFIFSTVITKCSPINKCKKHITISDSTDKLDALSSHTNFCRFGVGQTQAFEVLIPVCFPVEWIEPSKASKPCRMRMKYPHWQSCCIYSSEHKVGLLKS